MSALQTFFISLGMLSHLKETFTKPEPFQTPLADPLNQVPPLCHHLTPLNPRTPLSGWPGQLQSHHLPYTHQTSHTTLNKVPPVNPTGDACLCSAETRASFLVRMRTDSPG